MFNVKLKTQEDMKYNVWNFIFRNMFVILYSPISQILWQRIVSHDGSWRRSGLAGSVIHRASERAREENRGGVRKIILIVILIFKDPEGFLLIAELSESLRLWRSVESDTYNNLTRVRYEKAAKEMGNVAGK